MKTGGIRYKGNVFAWIVVLIVTLQLTAISLLHEGLAPVLPFIQRSFNATNAQIGLIPGAVLLGGTIAMVIIGWLTDRLGIRSVLPFAFAFMGGGMALLSIGNSINQLVFLAFLMGIGASTGLPATAKAIMTFVSPHRRALAMGFVTMGGPLAGIIGAGVIPWLAENYGWQTAVRIMAVTIVATAVVFMYFYKIPREEERKTQPPTMLRALRQLSRNRALWAAALSGITLVVANDVFITFLILWLRDDLFMNVRTGGAFLALALTASIVGRMAWGWVGDYWGKNRAVVLAILSLLSVFSLVAVTLTNRESSNFTVGVVVVMAGFTTLSWQGVYHTVVAELTPAGTTASVTAFSGAIRRLGAFGMLPLFGWLVDINDNYIVAWRTLAVVAFIGTVILITRLIPLTRRNELIEL